MEESGCKSGLKINILATTFIGEEFAELGNEQYLKTVFHITFDRNLELR
jgi:hypothetical protein